MNPRTLLERNYEAIIGIAYPFYMTGNETDKGLARSIIQENLMGATFTGITCICQPVSLVITCILPLAWCHEAHKILC